MIARKVNKELNNIIHAWYLPIKAPLNTLWFVEPAAVGRGPKVELSVIHEENYYHNM